MHFQKVNDDLPCVTDKHCGLRTFGAGSQHEIGDSTVLCGPFYQGEIVARFYQRRDWRLNCIKFWENTELLSSLPSFRFHRYSLSKLQNLEAELGLISHFLTACKIGEGLDEMYESKPRTSISAPGASLDLR